jgi:hypothetical protein
MNNNEMFLEMVEGTRQLIRPWKIALIVCNVTWFLVALKMVAFLIVR